MIYCKSSSRKTMQSTMVLNMMIAVLLVAVPGIRSDTGSSTSDGSSGSVSDIFQVQQLINQESMLRLTLDKQLQDLRSMVFDLKSKLEQSEAKVNDLTSRLERSDEGCNKQVQSVESKICNVTDIVNDCSAAISSRLMTFDRVISDLQSNLSTLQGGTGKRRRTPSLYFSATLTSSYTTKTSSDVIKFDNVYVNKGNAYDPISGTFTSPVNGTYLFSFSFTNSDSNRRVHGRIVLNDRKTLLYSVALEDQEYNSGVGTILHPLTKGDRVQVIINENGAGLYSNYFTSFSGVLISN